MQRFLKIVPWLILALTFLAVLSLVLYHEIPRTVSVRTEGVLIRSDGTVETVPVSIRGSWKPLWMANAEREFTGTLEVQGIGGEVRQQNIDFTGDMWDAGLLFGGTFLGSGSLWVLTDESMESYIMIGSDTVTDSHFWVVVPAADLEDALALRDAWGLPADEFAWETE